MGFDTDGSGEIPSPSLGLEELPFGGRWSDLGGHEDDSMFLRSVGLNLQAYALWILRRVSSERLICLSEWTP